MRKRLALVLCCVALLLGTAIAPSAAAASDPVISSLNGVPGQTIDICVAGVGEVVSHLRYGKVAAPETVPAGTWKITARVASPGACKGRRLATTTVTWELDQNYTLVLWRPLRVVRIKQFENDMSLPGAGAATLTIRHMAKAGAINVWVFQQVRPTAPFDPSIANLGKGTSSVPITLAEGETIMMASPAKRTRAWSSVGGQVYAAAGSVYQAYLIGTEKRNYRIRIIGQVGEL